MLAGGGSRNAEARRLLASPREGRASPVRDPWRSPCASCSAPHRPRMLGAAGFEGWRPRSRCPDGGRSTHVVPVSLLSPPRQLAGWTEGTRAGHRPECMGQTCSRAGDVTAPDVGAVTARNPAREHRRGQGRGRRAGAGVRVRTAPARRSTRGPSPGRPAQGLQGPKPVKSHQPRGRNRLRGCRRGLRADCKDPVGD